MESNILESDDNNNNNKLGDVDHEDTPVVLSEDDDDCNKNPAFLQDEEYCGIFSPSININNGRNDIICSIPDLLFARQTYGTSTTYQSMIPPKFRVSNGYNDHLASRIAW